MKKLKMQNEKCKTTAQNPKLDSARGLNREEQFDCESGQKR